MEYALGLSIVWGLLFLPIGLVIGRVALGASARVQAAPLALATGLAAGILILGALETVGIEIHTRLAMGIMLGLAAGCWASLWRSRKVVSNYGRQIFGISFVMLTLIAVMQAPVFNPPSGPASYGAGSSAATQVAAIRAIATGQANTVLQRRAVDRYEETPSGFEQLAAFTVGLGNDDRGWTAFELTSLMIGLLAVLTALPMLVFARWRGLGRLGQFLLLCAGVLTPQVMLGIGLGANAAVAAVPFAAGALLALFLARRDRGWLAIALVNLLAVIAVAGLMAAIPILLVGGIWGVLHSRVREHLAASDTPVAGDRPLLIACAGLVVGAAAIAQRAFQHPGVPWEPSGLSLADALIAWPVVWLGIDLRPTVLTGWEILFWALGPVILLLAAVHGVRRWEGRELSVLGGVGATVALGAAAAGLWGDVGIQLIELTWLFLAPFLLVVALRIGGITRGAVKEAEGRHWRGVGPLATCGVLLVLSVAAASTTGSRFVHAPSLFGLAAQSESTLVLVSDPWIGVGVDGDTGRGVPDDVTDIDELTRPVDAKGEVLPARYTRILLDHNPFSSDPPAQYLWSGYDGRRPILEYRRQTDGADTAVPQPLRHDPVERLVSDTGPGGLVLPASARDCGSLFGTSLGTRGSCAPRNRAARASCPASNVKAFSARLRKVALATGAARPATLTPAVSACIDVPLAPQVKSLRLHVRDIGVIYLPGDAIPRGEVSQVGGPKSPLVLESRKAAATFGGGSVIGAYDVAVEGQFGAGVEVVGGFEGQTGGSAQTTIDRGYSDWSPLLGDLTLGSGVTIQNATSANASIGRVILRETASLARSCDISAPVGGTSVVNGPGRLPILAVDVVRKPRASRAQLMFVSFMSEDVVPRSVMLDWVAQFAQESTPTEQCVPPASAGAQAGSGGQGVRPAQAAQSQAESGSGVGSEGVGAGS